MTYASWDGERLKALRTRLGLTQKQMAVALLLHPVNGKRTVRRWEKGQHPIDGPARVVMEYFDHFGLQPEIQARIDAMTATADDE